MKPHAPGTAAEPAPERWLSIVVPCRNEAAHLQAFVRDALAQQQALPSPWRLELIVADGDSDDGSAEQLQALAAAEPRLRVVANPQRIVSSGLNRALAAARGEVLLRMDVHTRYAPDYAAQCLAALQRSGADNVGGPWHAQGQGAWGRAIAAAFQSRWVAGGARSRDLDYEGEVDTVYLGCWPRASFDRFGGFDEALVRNQDDEHNLRIQGGGGRIWQSPAIRSRYVPRDALAPLARQWLQYGYWKPYVMRKHGRAAALRHHLPALLIAALVLAGTAALVWPPAGAWPAALLLGGYGLFVAAVSIGVWRARQLPAGIAWRLPVVVATMHLAYGLGSLWGRFDAWRGHPGRDRFARLTR